MKPDRLFGHVFVSFFFWLDRAQRSIVFLFLIIIIIFLFFYLFLFLFIDKKINYKYLLL